jgi:signal transduction histidine kinase/ActR/RegA family two-component response regulator
MLSYNLEVDTADQRKFTLKLLLGISSLLVVLVIAISSTLSTSAVTHEFGPWVVLLAIMFVSNEMRRRSLDKLATWIYVLGLMTVFSYMLWKSGPSLAIYLLMMLPLVISAALLDYQNTIKLGVLCYSVMLVITATHSDLAQALGTTFVPLIFIVVLVAVIFFNFQNSAETIQWATDLQKKDKQRAEMFYEQREQLSEALRELTHAKASLELSNKRLAEAQLRTEQVSQAKSVFLSNMSHELRTPLNVVIGYTSTMLDMPDLYGNERIPESYRTDIRLIKDSGYYLLGLINDILDLSKIEAGKLELHCSIVNLTDTFKGILATAIGLVKTKSIQVRPEYPDDLPLVWADPIRIRQIILNLMSNAIKFTETGSVTLQAAVEGTSVRITVIDTGIGIPEKALPHIFDRFEQAERDTDKLYGGTGLGLDISRRLARLHGGDLTAESELGKGSKFSFLLPVSTEQEMSSPNLLSPNFRSAERLVPIEDVTVQTILLIEDEASLRDMMHRTLEAEGHMVVDVQDGVQALEIAAGVLPDLIVLDIYLPNMSGWQLLERLKEDSSTASIPVLICTASEDEARARKMGATAYLHKPFSPEQLLAYVKDLLPQSTSIDSSD